MNIKSVIATVGFILISITGFSQYIYVQKLGRLGTITMPDSPKTVTLKGQKQFILNYQGVIFTANSADISPGLFQSSKKDSNYDDFINGMLKTLKGKLLYKENVNINGNTGVQFSFSAIIRKQQAYGYYRTVAVNDSLLTCGILCSNVVAKDNPNLLRYFNGFKVISPKEAAKIHNLNFALTAGKVTARIFMVILFAGIGLGIVLLIKKIAYRKTV